MSESAIIQLRKRGGLKSIVTSKNGAKLQPNLYSAKTQSDKEEGVLVGPYDGKTLLGTREFLCPHWDDIKKQWAFGGSVSDLSRLVKAMRLKYDQFDHPKKGQPILPLTNEDHPEGERSRLFDFYDPVFRNKKLYGVLFMENGRINFNMKDPVNEFTYLCYKGNSLTMDKSSDEMVNPYIAAGTKYELVSPKKENLSKRKDADKEIRAIGLLSTMMNNEDKMRAIATIMSLPQYSKTTDSNGLVVLLKETAAQNTSKSAKFGKTYQERFIELGETPDEDLNVMSKVITAINKALIRKRANPDHYLFNGDKIEVKTEIELINFFSNPGNQDKFLELENLLKI